MVVREACGLGQDLVASSCENCNELSSFIKGGQFLGQLSEYYRVNKGCTVWNYLVVGWSVSCIYFC
jgi:hypothetical protein